MECEHTDIKIENGSEIHSLDSKDDINRGYIRGRRLTDKEYQSMLFREQVKAEERVSKIIELLGLK